MVEHRSRRKVRVLFTSQWATKIDINHDLERNVVACLLPEVHPHGTQLASHTFGFDLHIRSDGSDC